MPKASALTYVGIAKEVTPGVPVAPTMFIPMDPPKPQDTIQMLADKNLRGSMVDVYGYVTGMASTTLDLSGNVYIDSIGWFLAALFGDVVTTGTVAPFTTAFAAANTAVKLPGTYTITDYNGIEARTWAGCSFTELSFKMDGESLFTYTAKAVGAVLSAVATTPTPSFSAVPARGGWHGVTKIGGTVLSTLISASVDIKRPVEPISTVDGNAQPYAMWPGNLEVSGQLDFVMEDDSQLANYLNNSQPTLNIAHTISALDSLIFNVTNAAYQSAVVDRSKSYVQLTANFDAIANATDIGASGGLSPAKVTLANSVAANTYR